jgi:copper(I)-binding protein
MRAYKLGARFDFATQSALEFSVMRQLGSICLLLAATSSLALADATSQQEGKEPSLSVHGAVSHPNAGVPVGVAYMKIENHQNFVVRLVAVRTPAAKRVELHETIVSGDMTRMKHHPDGFDIPPRGEVVLEPGGKHVMLLGLVEPLKAGDSFVLYLEFDRAGTLATEVQVEPRPSR